MMFTYPAVFRKLENGSYEGYFPDLDGCVFGGADLDEAINSAIEEERAWITVELEEEQVLPFISDREDIVLAENEHLRNIAVIVRLMDGFDE